LPGEESQKFGTAERGASYVYFFSLYALAAIVPPIPTLATVRIPCICGKTQYLLYL